MAQDIKRRRLSRRAFLASAGAVTVGVGIAGGYAFVQTPSPQTGQIINAFVSLLSDGQVEVVCPAQDLGQGAPLALAMIVAEEMGADITLVKIIAAPRDAATYGNPDFMGRMVTADSKTTRGYYAPLRLAGAEARLALVETVHRLKGWAKEQCRVAQHHVIDDASGASMSFAEIAASGHIQMPGTVTEGDLKPPSDFSLLGTSPAKGDQNDIVTGRKRFGVDYRDADTSIAILQRSPHLGGVVLSVDDSATKAINGVEAVVVLEDAVAVVGVDTWSALKGRAALMVEWSSPHDFSSAAERDKMEAAFENAEHPRVVLRNTGTAFGGHEVSAEFYAPCLKHVIMEPLNATAKGKSLGLGVEISGSTQSLDLDMRYAAKTWKTAPFMIDATGRPSGGAYGRRVLNDAVRDAATVAKQFGRPVQVIRPMLDELQRGQVRPAALQRLAASLSPDGDLVSWQHNIASDATLSTHLPSSLKGANGDEDNTATDGAYHSYRTPHDQIEWSRVETLSEPGFLRGVSAGYTVWAIETMVERLALSAGRDPLEWRLAHLDDPRLRAVLSRAAEMAGWGAPDRHLGLGIMSFRGSSVASVGEVRDGRVTGLWIAADVGRVIHRDNVLGQIEGGAIWGLSMALRESLTFGDGRAQIDSLADYPVLSSDELPPIQIELVAPTQDDPPFGVGEIGVPSVIPAICNAMERATGQQFDRLPLAV